MVILFEFPHPGGKPVERTGILPETPGFSLSATAKTGIKANDSAVN